MAKIDFNTVLLDLNGNPIQELDQDNTPVGITLKMVCLKALVTEVPDEKIEGAERYARYVIANKLTKATKPLNIKSEEVTKLKDLIGKMYTAIVVGRCWDLLDGLGQDTKEEVAE